MAKNIKELFINIRIGELDSIVFDSTSTWFKDGRPMINLKSQDSVGEMIQVDTMIYPTNFSLTPLEASEALDPKNTTVRAQYRTSGVIFGHRPAIPHTSKFSTDYVINKRYENEYYQAAYKVTYPNAQGDTSIGKTSIDVLSPSEGELAHCHQPIPANLNITSSLVSVDAQNTNIQVNFGHKNDVNNDDITSSPYAYKIKVYNINDDIWLEPDGTEIPSGDSTSNNYFASGNFSIVAPFKTDSEVDGGFDKLYTQDLYISYYDQEGVPTKDLIINTGDIHIASSDFDDGFIKGFTQLELKKIEEVPIRNDVSKKYRYSVGIEDIGINNEIYTKEGSYISRFYTIDNPIYTFNFNVKEMIPQIENLNPYDVIKYYVSFHGKDWIRISPVNRDHEYDVDGVIIPKFIVLDDINMGNISTEILELKYDFAAYLFKMRIDFDMSTMDTGNFVSPAVDYFECNITDRNSIFWNGI